MRKSVESSRMAGFLLPVVFGGLVLASAANGFEYKDEANWPEHYPACGGKLQSPIHLSTAYSTPLVSADELKFINYNQKYDGPVTIRNNNHTVDIIIPTAGILGGALAKEWATYDNKLPKITGGPLGNEEYVAEALHFHWGPENGIGSEHAIDGARGSLEMHIIHRNIKYASIAEAKDKENGLTVLGVLFKASAFKPIVSGLLPITKNLKHARTYDASFDIKNVFTLGKLLEKLNLGYYFSYKGSLTTPPCYETVNWIFFQNIIPISNFQMSEFRKTLDSNGKRLEHIFRQLQPINNRPVYLRKPSFSRPWYKVVNNDVTNDL